MKKHLIPTAAALLLALLVTGCETTGGIPARAKEKSETYAALKPWQKKYIDKGSVSQGFTPDMVYIAMGNPDKVETEDLPEGKAEMWTYSRVYPSVDALHGYRRADFSTSAAYMPAQTKTQTDVNSGKTVPLGMSTGGGSSIGTTGGPQGGSMEPADLRSYTVKVLFANGQVVKVGADENP